MRKEQVIKNRIRKSFFENGEIKTAGMVLVDDNDLYKPTATLSIPKTGALSDATAHNQTIDGLIKDFDDLARLYDPLQDRIKQLHKACVAAADKLTSYVSAQSQRIRRIAEDKNITDVITYDAPNPAPNSSGIAFNPDITLKPATTETINITASSIEPFADGDIVSYTPSQVLKFPLKYETKSTGSRSGVNIELKFKRQTVTRLSLTGTPVMVRVMVREGDDLKTLAHKHTDGHTALMFSNTSTDHLIIRLYTYNPSTAITLEECTVYGDRYAENGTYISNPIPLDMAGPITVQANAFQPDGTTLNVQVAEDMLIDGCFYHMVGGSPVPINPDRDSITGVMRYGTVISGAKTPVSSLIRHRLVPGVPNQFQLTWKPAGRMLYNCIAKSVQSFNTSNPGESNKLLAELSDTVIPESVKLRAGRDAWLFIVASKSPYPDDIASTRMGIALDDYWQTYLELPEAGEVRIANDDGLLRNIQVLQVHSYDNAPYPDTYSMLDRANNTFSGVLPAGVYRIRLYVDAVDSAQLNTRPATKLTGYTPVIETPENTTLWATYKKASALTEAWENIHPVRRLEYYERKANKIYIYPFVKNVFYDIYYNNNNDMTAINTDSKLLAGFYDISYLEQVDDIDRSKFLFVKADLSTTDPGASPIVRTITIALEGNNYEE